MDINLDHPYILVEDVEKLVPEALDLVENLTLQAERINNTRINVELDIAALKDLIKYARDEANQVQRTNTLSENMTTSTQTVIKSLTKLTLCQFFFLKL